MASPLYDPISIRLSRRLGDPVAAATTDGKKFTSALRDTYLNAAIKKMYIKRLRIINPGQLAVDIIEPGFFRGVLGDEGNALASNVLTLSTWTGGVAWIISARNSTTAAVVNPIPQHMKSLVEASANTFLTASTTNQFYSIEGAKLKVYGSGATDTIWLQYIKPHTTLAANGSTDIVVPAEYYEQVLDLAEALALSEFPTDKNIARAAAKTAEVLKEIYG